MEKENFFQRLINKARGKTTYQRQPEPYKKPLIDKEKYLYALGMNETSVIPEENRYTFSQPSGDPKLGLALGKYQVTEEELRVRGGKYIGPGVTAKEFLENPSFQDQFVYNRAKDLATQGYSVQQAADIHRRGFTNSSDPGSDVYQDEDYVNKFNINYK